MFIQMGKKKKREKISSFFLFLNFTTDRHAFATVGAFWQCNNMAANQASSTEAPYSAKGTALQQLGLRVCSLWRAEKLPPRPVRSRQEAVPMGKVKRNIKTSEEEVPLLWRGMKVSKK